MIEGVKLAILGMTTVYLFLLLLLLLMKVSALLLKPTEENVLFEANSSFAKKVAAITIAVKEYENEAS